jgi:isopropylmalate/homocitrate/citramalate synthase
MPDPFRFSQYRPRPLEIIDSTLREGQQTSLLHDHYKYFFTRADKEEILRALIIYGVKFVESAHHPACRPPRERKAWMKSLCWKVC